jgi:hypothetical protein
MAGHSRAVVSLVALATVAALAGCDDGSPSHDDDKDDAGVTGDAGPDGSALDAEPEDGGETDASPDGGDACPTDIPTTICDDPSWVSRSRCATPLPGSPCGFTSTEQACSADGECGEDELCFRGICHLANSAATGAGCIELAIELEHGGGAPDRVYDLLLHVTPPIEADDGSSVECATGMVAENHVPKDPDCVAYPEVFGGNCDWSYFTPVDLTYDADGFHASGGSGYTVLKLKGEGPALAATWAGAEPLHFAYSVHWHFGGDELDRSSLFTATVWSTEGSCASRTMYQRSLAPPYYEQGDTFTAEPVTTTLCP